MPNHCKNGYYCSIHVKQADVKKCLSNQEPQWSGRCPFQDGNRLPPLNENGRVDIECTDAGCACTLSPHEYIRWNQLCPHRE